MCLSLLTVGISLFVAITATVYFNIYTPVYEIVEVDVGDPELTQWSLGFTRVSIAFRIPLTIKNPNPYSIKLVSKQGQVVPEGFPRQQVGVLEAMDVTVPAESTFTNDLQSSLQINELSDILVLLQFFRNRGIVPFLFEMESLQGLVQISLLGNPVTFEFETSRFCVASFDTLQLQLVEGSDVLCSETREELAKRLPSQDIVPEGIEDAEQQKTVVCKVSMIVGYVAASIFAICFLWNCWKACSQPTSVREACGDAVRIKQPAAVSLGRAQLST